MQHPDAAALPMQGGHSSGQSGFLKTLFNSVNILCGVGLLATPYASAQKGWSSLLLLAMLGVHCCSPMLYHCECTVQESANVMANYEAEMGHGLISTRSPGTLQACCSSTQESCWGDAWQMRPGS